MEACAISSKTAHPTWPCGWAERHVKGRPLSKAIAPHRRLKSPSFLSRDFDTLCARQKRGSGGPETFQQPLACLPRALRTASAHWTACVFQPGRRDSDRAACFHAQELEEPRGPWSPPGGARAELSGRARALLVFTRTSPTDAPAAGQCPNVRAAPKPTVKVTNRRVLTDAAAGPPFANPKGTSCHASVPCPSPGCPRTCVLPRGIPAWLFSGASVNSCRQGCLMGTEAPVWP